MRLEDALLYLVVDDALSSPADAAAICGMAIAGGVDIVRLASSEREILSSASHACREDDAIFIVEGRPPRDVDADGLHLNRADEEIGVARATAGLDSIIGVSSTTLDEAILALEVGADYLVHEAGTSCPMEFACLKSDGVPLFAAGLRGIEDAQQVVDGGVYRLCLNLSTCSGQDLTEEMAQYSRLLGRCI